MSQSVVAFGTPSVAGTVGAPPAPAVTGVGEVAESPRLRHSAIVAWLPDCIAALCGAGVLALSTTPASVLVGMVLAWPVLLTATGASRLPAVPGTRRLQIHRVLRATALLGLTLWMVAALTSLPTTQATLVAATAMMTALSVLTRAVRPVRGPTRVLVVGEADQVASTLEELRRGSAQLSPVGVCTLGEAPTAPGSEARTPLGHGLEAVLTAAASCSAQAVLVLPGPQVGARDVERLGWHLGPRGVEVLLDTGLLDVAGARTSIAEVDGLRLLHLRSLPSAGPARALKSVTERLATLVLLALAAPLLLTIGLLVRWDSTGPALFAQRRVGRDGREFTMYKFRTMQIDAEDRVALLSDQNEASGLLFKIRHDPRVTRVGAFLRRYSLDELPQLINVLRGEMSLVGPRPALPCEVARYDADTRRRLAVQPGLTGLWQVSGRSDLPWAEAIRLDLRYVDNWSLGLDLAILFRTFGAVLSRRGAY